MIIDERDLRIDIYRPAVPNAPSSIRITHLPSGIYRARGNVGSEHRAKREMIEEIEDELIRGRK